MEKYVEILKREGEGKKADIFQKKKKKKKVNPLFFFHIIPTYIYFKKAIIPPSSRQGKRDINHNNTTDRH